MHTAGYERQTNDRRGVWGSLENRGGGARGLMEASAVNPHQRKCHLMDKFSGPSSHPSVAQKQG